MAQAGRVVKACHKIQVREVLLASDAAKVFPNLDSDIDIKILFSKVDSPRDKPLLAFCKTKTRQKWLVFKEIQL